MTKFDGKDHEVFFARFLAHTWPSNMPTPAEEVTEMFDAASTRRPEAMARCCAEVQMLAEGTQEAFTNVKIRKALWYLLVDHHFAMALRMPVLMIHKWLEGEIEKANASP